MLSFWKPVAGSPVTANHRHAREIIRQPEASQSQQACHLGAGSSFLTGAIENEQALSMSYDWTQHYVYCHKLSCNTRIVQDARGEGVEGRRTETAQPVR